MDRTDVTLTPLTIKLITRPADQSAPLPPTRVMEHVQTISSCVDHKSVNITALITKSTTGPVGHSAFIQASSAIEAVLMAGLPVVTGVRKTAMRIATETVAPNVSATTTSVKACAPLTETIHVARITATPTPHIIRIITKLVVWTASHLHRSVKTAALRAGLFVETFANKTPPKISNHGGPVVPSA